MTSLNNVRGHSLIVPQEGVVTARWHERRDPLSPDDFASLSIHKLAIEFVDSNHGVHQLMASFDVRCDDKVLRTNAKVLMGFRRPDLSSISEEAAIQFFKDIRQTGRMEVLSSIASMWHSTFSMDDIIYAWKTEMIRRIMES